MLFLRVGKGPISTTDSVFRFFLDKAFVVYIYIFGGEGRGLGRRVIFLFDIQDIAHEQNKTKIQFQMLEVRRNVLTVHFEIFIITQTMHLRFIVEGLFEILFSLIFFFPMRTFVFSITK